MQKSTNYAIIKLLSILKSGVDMKLVEFSVTNYRSITAAHKIKLNDLTVLVGKNNEGKSNLLNALDVAMNAVIMHSDIDDEYQNYKFYYESEHCYDWQKDFPIQYQNRSRGVESIFKLQFQLEGEELNEFHSQMGIRGNDAIPICVKFGKDNKAKIEVPKRGSSSYNKRSKEITKFISKKISFNYIQAVRTDEMAIDALENAIFGELKNLNSDETYKQALLNVNKIEEGVLNKIAQQLKEPLGSFLPNIHDVQIKRYKKNYRNRYSIGSIDVIIDDGTPTSIYSKGDGIKSLVTLAILKDKRNKLGASVIAIEEPESHLHSGAIHSLVNVINKMSENNQVIITTHNPLFVQQNNLSSNIIVDKGTARPAKSISEIRDILGVWPSDNLRNARFVLVVEGENDRTALTKILPLYSNKIKNAINSNQLVIKSLGGVGNLNHVLFDLKNNMCKFIVLLDNDKAGNAAADKAIETGFLKDSEVKFTICNGSPEAEFEDCLNKKFYQSLINKDYGVDINKKEFKSNGVWSDRLEKTFISQGSRWNNAIEEKVKSQIAQYLFDNITYENINDFIVEQKSTFITGVVDAIESMLNQCVDE